MSELITIADAAAVVLGSIASVPVPLPEPRVAISVRVATLDDLAFIDGLQKKTSRMVGFMPTKQIEGKIEKREIIVAESGGVRVGYLIGCDRYFKHDDVGIIYAINVVPEFRRSLVAAALLKAQFERSAYGCRLYCCWCAQDLEANQFWEAMGFQAIAYRAGSETRGSKGLPRVHIFWQKRIRAGDATTPWWYPSQTTSGSIREDRIVLPIPRGMHWSDAKPIVLPGDEIRRVGTAHRLPTTQKTTRNGGQCPPYVKTSRPLLGAAKFQFASAIAVTETMEKPKRERAKRVKAKHDPSLVAAARELRDRYLEQVNESPTIAHAKYDVTRAIEARTATAKAIPELIEPATKLLAA